MTLSNILLTPLSRIETPGGNVLHAMKQSDIGYSGFGEAYFSFISKDSVKAWKKHLRMTMNIVVPSGQVRFVFRVVNNEGIDEFRIEEIGDNRYMRITVPPGIWFGFQGIDSPQSLVMNIASIPHDPSEVERLSLTDINYFWS